MSEQRNPIEAPSRRRSDPRAPAGQPGRRRPVQAATPPARRPRLKRPSRKALAWTGGVLAAIAIAIAVLVAVWDWNWFRGPVERYASLRMHRDVTIAGDLDVRPFSWRPTATVSGVTVGNPRWAGAERMGAFEKITVQIRLIPLLWGHLDIRRLQFDRPQLDLFADAKGRRNWDFSDGRDRSPAKLPPVRNFIVNDGRIDMKDVQRRLAFHATLQAHEKLGEHSRGFEMTGQGTLNAQPFRMIVSGGPLLNIDKARPYPFDAEIRAGQTFVTAKGQVPHPFDLGHFQMALTARGPDLALLYPLTGLAFPNTPPYSLRGRLSRNELLWSIDDLSGTVGRSDLAGALSVETGRKRPFLKADLRSRTLNFPDLGALFGGRPVAGASRATVAEIKAGPKVTPVPAQERLFSDATLDLTRMRAMDADVTYKALSIRNAPVKLTAGQVRVRLDDALLRADPLQFDLPQGRIQGYANLNARKAIPVTDLDLRLTNARIEHLVPFRFEGAPPLTGAIVGRARLTGSGNSVHKAFASADGEVMVVAPGGEIRKAFAELAGVNVVKGLGLLLKHDQSTTPVRCAVARFDTRKGQMIADTLVLDTGPVLITGKGAINLDTERMDFTAKGHNKKFRLFRVLLPVTAEGPLRAPKLGVKPGAAIAQGAIGAGLGSALSPLAAILPFVDPGLAKDANCSALVGQAAAQGAPVKTVR